MLKINILYGQCLYKERVFKCFLLVEVSGNMSFFLFLLYPERINENHEWTKNSNLKYHHSFNNNITALNSYKIQSFWNTKHIVSLLLRESKHFYQAIRKKKSLKDWIKSETFSDKQMHWKLTTWNNILGVYMIIKIYKYIWCILMH